MPAIKQDITALLGQFPESDAIHSLGQLRSELTSPGVNNGAENCRHLLHVLETSPQMVDMLLFRYCIQREVKTGSVMNARFLYDLLLAMVQDGTVDHEDTQASIVVDRSRDIRTSARGEFVKVFNLMIRYDPSAEQARRYFADMAHFVGEGNQGCNAETCLVYSELFCSDGDVDSAVALLETMRSRYSKRELCVVESVYRSYLNGPSTQRQISMLHEIDNGDNSSRTARNTWNSHSCSVSSFGASSSGGLRGRSPQRSSGTIRSSSTGSSDRSYVSSSNRGSSRGWRSRGHPGQRQARGGGRRTDDMSDLLHIGYNHQHPAPHD